MSYHLNETKTSLPVGNVEVKVVVLKTQHTSETENIYIFEYADII